MDMIPRATDRKQDMAKAVFTTKVEPACDDLPEFRHHFPRSYPRQAGAAVARARP